MTIYRDLPLSIKSGPWAFGHCQGIAADMERRVMYFSFTTALLKVDFSGKLIGSVTGLLGHLGCIAFNEEDGRVYGSLEYKDDEIGRGILSALGVQEMPSTTFYIAAFDAWRIDRPGMNAGDDSIMRAAYLKEVAQDYAAPGHRYGCSGIDGLTIGPRFGVPSSEKSLYVAYGIYEDTAREDNDHQVLIRYEMQSITRYLQPLSQTDMHASGPDAPDEKLFVFTGNTCYGVQNLEYDPYTGDWLMAVYKGSKPAYPNHPFFVIDGAMPPHLSPLQGCGGEKGLLLQLKKVGLHDAGSDIYGFDFAYGSTGLFAIGDGRYYVSHHAGGHGSHSSTARLYRWDGITPLILCKPEDGRV